MTQTVIVSAARTAIGSFQGTLAPVRAVELGATVIRAVIERAGWKLEDVDLIEANEAFAVQSLAVRRLLGFDPDRVNVNGGAVALGHPIGASGCRVLVTLLHEMQRRTVRRGLATLCIGGGQGIALAVECADIAAR